MKSMSRDENLDFLFKGILTLNSVEECYHFFEDLCTVSELQEMSRRMQAAKLLKDNGLEAYSTHFGALPKSDIATRTGLSTATISRVNRCLKYGTEGYISVLENIEKAERRGR